MTCRKKHDKRFRHLPITGARGDVNFLHMNGSQDAPTIPVACAAEILLDLSIMRDECVAAAQKLSAANPVDETVLEECCLLDEALAAAHRALAAGLQNIKRHRAGRSI
jgi:hypothetical protein